MRWAKCWCIYWTSYPWVICFGLPLQLSQELSCIWEEKAFALFAIDSVWLEMGLRPEQACFAACVCCLTGVQEIWRSYKVFGASHSGQTVVLAFSRRSHLSGSSFMLTTCLLGISPLEPGTMLGVTLQGYRGGVMEIHSPPSASSVPSFLAPLCLWLSQWWHQSYGCLYSLIYPPSRSLIIGT